MSRETTDPKMVVDSAAHDGAARDDVAGRPARRAAEEVTARHALIAERVARAHAGAITCHVAGTTFRSLDRVLRADGSIAVEAAEDVLALGAGLRLEREPGEP